jgi:thiopeptide-type bacteriocin biosynthesis protein
MSIDHLTLPTSITDRVEKLIADGRVDDPHEADSDDLADAVETYRAAGRAALQRRDERRWFQARITPRDWTPAETVFATQVGPLLDRLPGRPRWWFLRKHPCWRIRVHTGNHTAVKEALDDLVTGHAIAGWRPGVYEPEIAAFGGLTGIDIIHDLFCADSQGVLAYARQDTPAVARRELSLLLICAMHKAADLDGFETGDVFARIAGMRPTPARADTSRIAGLAQAMKPLLTATVSVDSGPFNDPGTAAYAVPWLTGFTEVGRRLGEAAAAGNLDRGLRAILAQAVIFHWNRLNLPAPAQSVLAHAAKAALLPPGS